MDKMPAANIGLNETSDQILFFKDKIIRGTDLELIFHKDYPWILNEKPLPVVSYILTNCQNLSNIEFDNMDEFYDGIIVNIRQENNHSVFETTDSGEVKIKVVCDKVIKAEREYNREDFMGLIKEVLKQRDNEFDIMKELKQQEEDLKHFMKHELDIAQRKIEQADWLTEDKKHFLEGQQNILKKIIEAIERREKNNIA